MCGDSKMDVGHSNSNPSGSDNSVTTTTRKRKPTSRHRNDRRGMGRISCRHQCDVHQGRTAAVAVFICVCASLGVTVVMAAQNSLGRITPSPRPMAIYSHIPKTGGSSIIELVRCARRALSSNSTARGDATDEPSTISRHDGLWVDDPVEDGVVDHAKWDAMCIQSRGSPCTSDHHWPHNVFAFVASEMLRAGATPSVVVGSVRNPFAFYVSRFFQRYYDDRADQDGEAHKCTPELGDPKGPACFRRWLITQIGSNVGYKMSLTHTLDYYLGSDLLQRGELPSVDSDKTSTSNRIDLDGKNGVVLAWVRTESLVKDLSELWLAVTGRQLPPQCISALKHENPSGHSNICDYYDNTTTALVRAADAQLFTKCGYVKVPHHVLFC